jgi:hypothetical protein
MGSYGGGNRRTDRVGSKFINREISGDINHKAGVLIQATLGALNTQEMEGRKCKGTYVCE